MRIDNNEHLANEWVLEWKPPTTWIGKIFRGRPKQCCVCRDFFVGEIMWQIIPQCPYGPTFVCRECAPDKITAWKSVRHEHWL